MHRATRSTITLLVALAASCGGSAHAAEYRVVQCANAPHEFAPVSTHPAFYAEDKCGSIAALSLRGVPGARPPTQQFVQWFTWAPPGTTFTRWQATFQGGNGDSTGALALGRVCADYYCAAPMEYLFLGLENWGAPATYSWQGSGALMLQFALTCSFGGTFGCTFGNFPPGADMFAPEMTLNDHHAPSPPQLVAGMLQGWQSGKQAQAIAFSATDVGGGVSHVIATVPGGGSWSNWAPCARGSNAFARLVPCPLTHNGLLGVDLSSLADGRHELQLHAFDVAGQGATSGPYPILIDNTPPASPRTIGVLNGDGWRAQDGFAIRWQNPSERHAPIVAAHWQLCAAGGGCRSGRVAATNISGLDGLSMGRSGEHLLRVWLEDAAGNQDAATAAGPLRLRLDAEPPRLAFEPRNPADPLRVAVRVDDGISGLATGTIEMRREGTDTWRALATSIDGKSLIADLADEEFPDGRYELRARAADHAGNEASTDRDRDGERALVQLPVRIRTDLRAGRRVSRMRRVTVRRKGRKRVVKRRTTHLRPTVTSAAGKPVPLEGVVTDPTGAPLAEVNVEVFATDRYASGAFEQVGVVRTDRTGKFSFLFRPERSRVIRFLYAGTRHVHGSSADVVVGVRASSTISTSDGSVLNGQSVVLRGRVKTLPVPSNGKLVEVQAFFRDRWRTFSTVRTNRRGRWVLPYQFGGTVGTVRYRFRAVLPREGGYPFEAGGSRVARVTVRGL